MDKIERLIEENRSLKQQLKNKDKELASVKAQLEMYKNKSRERTGYCTDVFILSDDFSGVDESLFRAYDDCLLEIDPSDEFGMYDYDNEYADMSLKKPKIICKPKLTREQEQRIVNYLKRKKCKQVTQKLRDDIYKKFGVSLTDKAVRDLMKRNGIYKREENDYE